MSSPPAPLEKLTYYAGKTGSFGAYNQSTNASPMRTAVEIESLYSDETMQNVIGQVVRTITYTSVPGQPQQKHINIKQNFSPSSAISGGIVFNAALFTPTLRNPLKSSIASGYGDFASGLTSQSYILATPISQDMNKLELYFCVNPECEPKKYDPIADP